MNKKHVGTKQHIKLLDKPIWTPSRKIAKLDSYSDDNGFKIRSQLGMPTMFDRLLLGYLMRESQRRENTNILQFDSMYALLKTIKVPRSGKAVIMVENSLEKWKAISMFFYGPLEYDIENHRKEVRAFGVIDNLYIENSNGVEIKFNDIFIELNQDKYTRRLRMDLLKHIGHEISPFALRLYEVLLIFLYHDGKFKIGINNLYKKLATEYDSRYRNRQLEQLENAMNELVKVDDELRGIHADFYRDNNMIIFSI